jgi:hypothetical protein
MRTMTAIPAAPPTTPPAIVAAGGVLLSLFEDGLVVSEGLEAEPWPV